ncbi:MAG TPA: hypothetical protein VI279_01720 [Rhodocyclaceae bacterium]
MKTIALSLFLLFAATGVDAKLAAPSPEAKAKADLAKAETAYKDKLANYQLCQSQNAAAKRYLASAAGKGKKPSATPPCEDPGKYVPPPDLVAALAAATAAAAAPAAPAATAPPPAPAAKK